MSARAKKEVFKVEFTKSAFKEFRKLPKAAKEKITEAVTFLKQNPRSELLHIKKLKGTDFVFRIRVGDYQVLYEIKNDLLIILVIKIGHRKDVYRGVRVLQ